MFPKKIKTRSFRKIVFRGTRGVTSDGAQERVRQLPSRVHSLDAFSLSIFRPNGWVETQAGCTRTSFASFRGQLFCLFDAQAVLHFTVPQ